MSQPGKVDHQPAFVLHSVPYKETSLIVELFTRDHGRVHAGFPAESNLRNDRT